MTFSAVDRRKYRMIRKLRMTPTLSAAQEIKIPKGSPNTTPLAVERKIDGRQPAALMKTSSRKLMATAQGPKERRKPTVSWIFPPLARWMICG